MPRMSDEKREAFLQQPITGVIATLRKDGMPYTVPVWWLWRDGEIWVTGTYQDWMAHYFTHHQQQEAPHGVVQTR